jgi:mono/diheme cytochrome c family protein
MIRNGTAICALALAVTCGVVAFASYEGGKPTVAAQDKNDGWTVPADAEAKKNPSPVDARMLATGKTIFKNKCEKCHGPNGRGDGPDADPDHQKDMDLTAAGRAAKNPEGVMFYKVANGRTKPKMPPFKDELTEQQIWSVVAYAQSLRK